MATVLQVVYGNQTVPIPLAATQPGSLIVVLYGNYSYGVGGELTGITGGSDVFHSCGALGSSNITGPHIIPPTTTEIWYAISGGGVTSISALTGSVGDVSANECIVIEIQPTAGKVWVFSNNGAGTLNLPATGVVILSPSVLSVGSDSAVFALSGDTAGTNLGTLVNGGVTFVDEGQQVTGFVGGAGYLLDVAAASYAAKFSYDTLSNPVASAASFAQIAASPTQAPIIVEIGTTLDAFASAIIRSAATSVMGTNLGTRITK